jgi:coproporphyrinogen III oxidase-like Fe-S oxidoreductase
MSINLPIPVTTNDARYFFDKYFVNQVSFPANEIDLTVAFFVKRGFDTESARSTAIVILNQARIDQVNVFDLLNSLKTLTDVQLSQVVAQILNSYREKISLLGYRIAPLVNTYESRNILI